MRIKIMGEDTVIEFDRGTGDNLLPEDIEEGYKDYIIYTVYDISNLDNVHEDDGGMILLENYFEDEFGEVFTYSDGDRRIYIDDDKVAGRVLDFIGYTHNCDYIFI